MAGRRRSTSAASGEQQIVFAHSFRRKREGFPLSGDPFLLYPASVVYQWGRKDAFPGADGSTITATTIEENNAQTILIYDATGNKLTEGSTGVKLVDITTSGVLNENTSQVYAIKKPLVFIYSTDEPRDWYTNTQAYQNNALWGEGTKKSIYDPCPQKWRVPADGTWSDFSNLTAPYYIQSVQTNTGPYHATNGRMYARLSWYGASAFRRTDCGEHSYVGRNGSFWSATAIQQDASGLSFNMNNVNVTVANYRATGFPVRCVQE